MNPYEHFFWNYALCYRKSWAWKAGVGGILPDLVYVGAFVPKVLSYRSFHEWMRDPLWDKVWNSVAAKSVHSFTTWGAGVLVLWLVMSIIGKKNLFERTLPFLIGWGLHIAADALTHVSDGYALFFPISSYRFPSPVSYWERDFHAVEFFWITHALMAGLLLLWAGWRLKQFLGRRPG